MTERYVVPTTKNCDEETPWSETSDYFFSPDYFHISDGPLEVREVMDGDEPFKCLFILWDIMDTEADPPVPAVRVWIPYMKLVHACKGQFSYQQVRFNAGSGTAQAIHDAVDDALPKYERTGKMQEVRIDDFDRLGEVTTSPVKECLPEGFDISEHLAVPAGTSSKSADETDMDELTDAERAECIAQLIRYLRRRFSDNNDDRNVSTVIMENDLWEKIENLYRSDAKDRDALDWMLMQNHDLSLIKNFRLEDMGWGKACIEAESLAKAGSWKSVLVKDEDVVNAGIIDSRNRFNIEVDGEKRKFAPYSTAGEGGSLKNFWKTLMNFYIKRGDPDRPDWYARNYSPILIFDKNVFNCIKRAIYLDDYDDDKQNWEIFKETIPSFDLKVSVKSHRYYSDWENEPFMLFEKDVAEYDNVETVRLNRQQLKDDGFVSDDGYFRYVNGNGKFTKLEWKY